MKVSLAAAILAAALAFLLGAYLRARPAAEPELLVDPYLARLLEGIDCE